MKVWDCFTYFNEKELLDFRIHHVYPYVDKIVIVESNRTYAGKPNEPNFDISEYGWASDKIIHLVTNLDEHPPNRWFNEAKQRADVADGYKDAHPDDIIFFSCVDEIIKPEIYASIHNAGEVLYTLSLDNYYYYFNGRDVGDKPDHPMPIVFTKKLIEGSLHEAWERRAGYPVIEHAGWHFSYLGGIDRIKEKLSAYSHAENDTPQVRDALEMNIINGKDIFGRPDHRFEFVEIDDTFPEYLVKNQEKYRDLIYQV